MESRNDKVSEFFNTLEIENLVINDYVNASDFENINSFDELYDLIDNNGGFNVEIIYYSDAIAYLADNDPSLKESLEIAAEYGFELENLNSEVLASLLASQKVRENFGELQNEIDDFFTDLIDDDDE
jgi:hypothetical protein